MDRIGRIKEMLFLILTILSIPVNSFVPAGVA
jgi:hypothetical protein